MNTIDKKTCYILDPIPGGCNMTFKTEIAPYQLIKLFDDLIRVDMQAPSLSGVLCELFKIRVDFYHLYLGEKDYSKDGYFEGIAKMLTVENIVKYGRQVNSNILFKKLEYATNH